MELIKVSVIVPVYNTEKYLPQCLESILAQTLNDIEVICINNGSTDTSGEILEKYAQKDKRVHVIHSEKVSIGAARNLGYKIAQGKYIGFVDSDDFIDVSMYQSLYERAEYFGADIAITNINLFYNDSGDTAIYRNVQKFSQLQKKGSFTPEEFPWIIRCVGIWDKLYNHDFLEKFQLRNPENIIYEDHLFSFQSLTSASKITVVDKPLYFYRKELKQSITGQEIKNDIYKMDFLKISDRIYQYLTKNKPYSVYRDDFIRYEFENAMWHQSNIVQYHFFYEYFQACRSIIPLSELKRAHQILKGKARIYSYILHYNACLSFYLICRLHKRIKYYFKENLYG